MPNSRNLQVPWQQEAVIRLSQSLLHSFQHWTGHALIDTNDSPILVARRLFEASFVLVSHGTEPDPIFNYGNQKALELWQLNWEAFTKESASKLSPGLFGMFLMRNLDRVVKLLPLIAGHLSLELSDIIGAHTTVGG